MHEREADFTEHVPIRCLACTWNVNGKKSQEDLQSWLMLDSVDSEDDLPCVYAIGFQEIVDLNAANVVRDSSSKDRSSFWAARLSETLNRAADKLKQPNRKPRRYQLVLERHLVGILLCVFVLDKHIPYVREPQATTSATGIMGIMGNKGGAVARLQLYDSTLCFVCAHLAAHRDNVEGRNSDYHSIIAKTRFKEEKIHTDEEKRMSIGSSASSNNSSTRTYGINDHEYVVWLGDFNYRIDAVHSTSKVISKTNGVDLPWLLRNDQLNLQRAAGKCFVGFEEAPIKFMPTYKYQPGTNHYERRPDKKLRRVVRSSPVLPKTAFKANCVRCIRARGARRIRPQTCCRRFGLHVKVIVEEKRRIVYREVIKCLDKWETTASPSSS